MLRLGNKIRLTKREVERFIEITGVIPVNIHSLEALDAYVAYCQGLFPGDHKDERFLRWLINRERSLCLGLRA